MKKQRYSGEKFDRGELNELERLVRDMEKGAKEIASDKKLLKLFASQFAVRMNNEKDYSEEKISAALEGGGF